MKKQGDELVREACRQAARDQGGTNLESSGRGVAEKSPEANPANDLDSENADEAYNSGGMGYAGGEYRKRQD